MKIRLEVYLPFRGRGWWRGVEQLSPGTTLAQLTHRLGLDGRPDLSMLVNGRFFPDHNAPLAEGDQVTYVRRSEGG